jgi:hypothetical protein
MRGYLLGRTYRQRVAKSKASEFDKSRSTGKAPSTVRIVSSNECIHKYIMQLMSNI